MTPMPASPRRWFAFRLRTLLVLVAALACLLWLMQWAVGYFFPNIFFHDFYIGAPP
jgi:hypothetical protein